MKWSNRWLEAIEKVASVDKNFGYEMFYIPARILTMLIASKGSKAKKVEEPFQAVTQAQTVITALFDKSFKGISKTFNNAMSEVKSQEY